MEGLSIMVVTVEVYREEDWEVNMKREGSIVKPGNECHV